MSFCGDIYSKRTLDFVERLQQRHNFDEISQLVVKELEWFGFTCVTAFSLPGPGAELQDGIMLNNRPPEFTERYFERNYLANDPCISELRRNLNPYSWNDLRNRRKMSKAERTILDEAGEFGINDGFVIPIVTLSGSTSLFCPCGPQPDLSPRARAAIELIGIYSNNALRRALMRLQQDRVERTPLTPREREILQWVAAGKTDEEIGEILSLGTTTVTSHVENAKRKLDAFRRTYAVVQAIRLGEISL